MDRAAEVHLEVMRRLSPARRLEIMAAMCDAMRALVAAGIRDRHPDWPELDVQRELRRLHGALPPEPIRG